jgi:magnesium-transporting ATPase (P-type)
MTADGERYQEAVKKPLDEMEKQRILNDFMEQKMTKLSHRAIAFSYCDMPSENFEHLMREMQGDIDDTHEIEALERDQVFLALVGLKDPVRDNIKKVVSKAAEAGVTVRLISGDNLSTTSAVAVDTGILTNEEFEKVGSGQSGIAMDASEFRQICGDVITRENEVEEGNEPTFTYSLSQNNQQQFDRIIETLKVIGRAEPQDKLRLVAGLKGMRSGMDDDDTPLRRVAVVGEGINDIDAFKAADVSFAVQDGTSMARNNASMILQTNDFDSCMRAVMWGRNIYMNVQRFLQF